MNKPEAIANFKESFPGAHKHRDKAGVRTMWNNYVDCLQKAGDITQRQAEIWVNPFLSKKDR